MFSFITLFGYYDVTLLIAVVGLYVLLAVLWVVYSLVDREPERGAAAISIERRRPAMERDDVERLEREIVLLRSQADEAEDHIQVLQESVDRMRLLFQLQLQREEAGFVGLTDHTDSIDSPEFEPVDEPVDEMQATAEVDDNADEEPVILSLHEPMLNKYADYKAYADSEMGVILMKRPTQFDDLTRIWGVGAVNQNLLNQNGVFFFEQIANWNEQNVGKFNEVLSFKGRIEREQWVAQAKRLADESFREAA